MQTGSRYIIATGISSLVVSLLYFLSLVLGMPFFITVPVICLAVFIVLLWVLNDAVPIRDSVPQPLWALLILVAGVSVIVVRTYPLADQYGSWDAWGIWNFHAKYLADPANWRKMFQNVGFLHPDYPLYVPALNAFFIRLFSGKYIMAIPFITAFSITLYIPVLIYLENAKKNLAIAAIVLFLFAFDPYYLTVGVYQFADTPMAFFLLCAFICMNYADEDKKYITISAACLGCCMWIKNEGCILAAVFILFYLRTFFSKRNIKAFAAGIAAPLLVFLIFKLHYAPDGGILRLQNKGSLMQVFMKERYDTIWDYFKVNVTEKYWYVMVCVLLYVLLCIAQRKWPDKQFSLVVCCVIAYMMVYVVTPGGGIEWLLGTSQSRLMHQLMPALMYVLSQRFVTVPLLLPKKEAL